MSRRKISVVTPTLNRHKVMPGYLRTLTQQTVLPDEIVLVDAGESCEEIAKQALADSPIELVYLRSRRGTSVQRNVGIEAARGDILFFLDDDDLLQPTFIEHVVAAFDFQADPPVGAVAGVVEGAVNGSRFERLYRRVFRMGGATENGTAKVQDNAQVWWVLDPDRIREVPVVGTGHSAYLREAIGDERFDDFLPGYTFGEDVELAIRVAKRWTMVVTPHARLTHLYASANRVGEGERAEEEPEAGDGQDHSAEGDGDPREGAYLTLPSVSNFSVKL